MRLHAETVEIETETDDFNEIIKMLAPTLEYLSEDGYGGILALDLASVICEAAGYRSSSYTVTATREYPHLSSADTSLIPKTITESGRTLELEDVSWEAQHCATVDYEEIPDSYRAEATYTGTASRTAATGYITSAGYIGEISITVLGGTVYTAYFDGKEIGPAEEPVKADWDAPPVAGTEETPPIAVETAARYALPMLLALAALIAAAGIVRSLKRRRPKE